MAGQRRKGSNSHDIIIIGFDRAAAALVVREEEEKYLYYPTYLMLLRVLRSFSTLSPIITNAQLISGGLGGHHHLVSQRVCVCAKLRWILVIN